MSKLALRLKDVNEAGVYRITCQLADLRSAASDAGLVVFDADLHTVQSKGEFLAALAQAVAAPVWLGKNWDALADALQDLSWQPAKGYVLVLRNGGDYFHLGANDHVIAEEIMVNTVSYWKLQNKPFWVFFC